jgi:hypothetical protein
MSKNGDPRPPELEEEVEFTESYQTTLFLSYVGDDWVDVSYIEGQLILDDYRFAFSEFFPESRWDQIIDDLCYFRDLKTRIHLDKKQIKLPDKEKLEPR